MNNNKGFATYRMVHGFAHILIISLIAIVVIIFVAPIPYYISGTPRCLLIENCPRSGWNLGPSLYQRLSIKNASPNNNPDQVNNEVASDGNVDVEELKTDTDQTSLDINFQELIAKTEGGKSISVILTLNIEYEVEPNLSPEEITAQRKDIRLTQEKIIESLSDTDYQVYHQYESFPNMAARVDKEGLEILQDSGLVKYIQEDIPVPLN